MNQVKHTRYLPLFLLALPTRHHCAYSFSVWSNEWTTAKRNVAFGARKVPPLSYPSIPFTGTANLPFVGREIENVIPEEFEVGGRRSLLVEDFFASDHVNGMASSRMYQKIRSRAALLHPFIVTNRRLLHRHPELMYQEAQTASIIRKALTDMGIKYTNGLGKNKYPDRIPGAGGHGLIADIGTGAPPCVLLRADMDALPIQESDNNGFDFRSQNDGRMHACGHDGHVAMLLGAAAMLKEMEDSINGTVRLMFQPAEEGGAGAKSMREEGVLERNPRVDCAFGLHLWPTLPTGDIASRPGPLLSASDRFKVEFTGKGGHAAMPQLAIDPIVATSATIMNLQTIVSRGLSPLESGVVSVTKVEAGESFNVIPGASTMCGTVRALSTESLRMLRDKVDHIATQTAETYGCEAKIQHSPQYYPPTMNDPNLFEFSSSVVGPLCQGGKLKHVDPVMCGEDFAFIAEAVPSNFFFLGQGSGQNPRTDFGLHHEQFAIDEDVLSLGVELHVNLALRALKELSK